MGSSQLSEYLSTSSCIGRIEPAHFEWWLPPLKQNLQLHGLHRLLMIQKMQFF